VTKRTADPGWSEVIRTLPLLVIPVIGMRRMAANSSSLISMRMVWLVSVNALLFLWLPVILVGNQIDSSGSTAGAFVVVAAVGAFAQLLAPRFAPEPSFDTNETFSRSFQRATFVRIAFAELAAFAGLFGFVVSGAALIYGVGFVIAGAGLYEAAPRIGRIAALQTHADDTGVDIDVVASLHGDRLAR